MTTGAAYYIRQRIFWKQWNHKSVHFDSSWGIPTGWTMEPLTAELLEHRPGSTTAEASLSGQLPAEQ